MPKSSTIPQWGMTRFSYPGETPERLKAIDAAVRQSIGGCPRCLSIYESSGVVMCQCSQCGADRAGQWAWVIERASITEGEGALE